MAPAPQLTRWWERFQDRLAGAAVAAGASSPSHGRRHWVGGELADQRVTASTTFYGASVTKQLVATLLARTVLDGRVDTRAGISAYVPNLPVWTGPIRVHHLLHHTAALPQPRQLAVALGYSDDADGWSRLDNKSVLGALHQVSPPLVPPGHVFSYDNTGYILLAELLRSVCRTGPAELVRSQITQPLELMGTRLGGPVAVTRDRCAAPPATIGDGGLWTCLADLMTWLEAINAERFGADLTALVQSPGRLEDGTVLDYAWGVGPRPGPAGMIYLHGGAWPGWCAMTIRCPTTATAVAILAATDDMAIVSGAAAQLHDHLTTTR